MGHRLLLGAFEVAPPIWIAGAAEEAAAARGAERGAGFLSKSRLEVLRESYGNFLL